MLAVGPFFVLPLFALLSALWSDAPAITTRAGLQLLITAAAGAAIARCAELRQIVLALFLSALLICASAIPHIPELISGVYGLFGEFGSKNAFAVTALNLELFGLAVALDKTQHRLARLSGMISVPFALLLVAFAQSGGGAVLAGIVLALFPMLLLFGRMPVQMRGAASLLLLGGFCVVVLLLSEIERLIAAFRTDVLKKDATLTGRTELWQIADRVSAERPILGHGFNAYWRQGNLEVEKIWRDFGIGSRGGFNFHNEFIQIKVDLGYVGLGLFVILSLTLWVATAWRQLVAPSLASAFALTVLAVTYIRLFIECGLVSPFSSGLLLWFIFASQAFATSRASSTLPSAASPQTFRIGTLAKPPFARQNLWGTLGIHKN